MRKGRHASPHKSPPDLRVTASCRKPRPAAIPQATPPSATSERRAFSLPPRSLARRAGSAQERELGRRTLLPVGSWVFFPLRDSRAFSIPPIEAALTRLGGVNRFSSHLCLFSPVFSSSGRLHGRPRSQLWRPLRHHRECGPPSAQSTPSQVGVRAPTSFSVASGWVRRVDT